MEPHNDFAPADFGVRFHTWDSFRLAWERAVAARGFAVRTQRDWSTQTPGSVLEALDVLHWSDVGDRIELIADVDGALVGVTCGKTAGSVHAMAAAPLGRMRAANAGIDRLEALLPKSKQSDDVPIIFWLVSSAAGVRNETRFFTCPSWQEVSPNYPASVRKQLGGLVCLRPDVHGRLAPLGVGPRPTRQPAAVGGGQLILWHGAPGTGKTWALQALAREWQGWCRLEYVTDPESFLGSAEYLLQVLLRNDVRDEDGRENKWRLLVLEDTGELLHADAKTREGQRLSRLLNVVDGLLGRGLRLLVLVTTNEELQTLHPAAARPGRCACAIEFRPHQPEEAARWLREQGGPAWPSQEIRRPMSLADLYQTLGGGSPGEPAKRRIGFAP